MTDERPHRFHAEERPAADHTLTVTNRERLVISGVAGVASFDDQEILLETELGMLTVRGEELHIKQLDLESGRFAVDGMITAMTYSTRPGRPGRTGRSRGFFERLLR